MTDGQLPEGADPRCTGVENGRKVAFDLAEDGKAAITMSGGVASLAYRPTRRPKLPQVGKTIEIDGQSFTVLAVKDLKSPPFIRLALAPVPSPSAAEA